jgi:hypothetical protein
VSDTLFALFHIAGLLAVLIYAVSSCLSGHLSRGVLILVLLVVYYFLVLHKAVRKEIARRRGFK